MSEHHEVATARLSFDQGLGRAQPLTNAADRSRTLCQLLNKW
jgi:hypothetical protein